MNSDTPETDAEFDHLRFAVEPNQFGCESQRDVVVFGMRDFARKLERERNAAIQSAKDNSANFRRSEVKRIEAERERDRLRKDLSNKTGYAHLVSEIDRLRKVCDELEMALRTTPYLECDELSHGRGQYHSFNEACPVCEANKSALDNYNQLPHVKENNK